MMEFELIPLGPLKPLAMLIGDPLAFNSRVSGERSIPLAGSAALFLSRLFQWQNQRKS